jgi:hypothetical protein
MFRDLIPLVLMSLRNLVENYAGAWFDNPLSSKLPVPLIRSELNRLIFKLCFGFMQIRLSLFDLPWRLFSFNIFPDIDDLPLVVDVIWSPPLISVDPPWDFDCFDCFRFLSSLSVVDTGTLLLDPPFPAVDDLLLVGPFVGDLNIFSRGLLFDFGEDWFSLYLRVRVLEYSFLFHRRRSFTGYKVWLGVTRLKGVSGRKLRKIWFFCGSSFSLCWKSLLDYPKLILLNDSFLAWRILKEKHRPSFLLFDSVISFLVRLLWFVNPLPPDICYVFPWRWWWVLFVLCVPPDKSYFLLFMIPVSFSCFLFGCGLLDYVFLSELFYGCYFVCLPVGGGCTFFCISFLGFALLEYCSLDTYKLPSCMGRRGFIFLLGFLLEVVLFIFVLPSWRFKCSFSCCFWLLISFCDSSFRLTGFVVVFFTSGYLV